MPVVHDRRAHLKDPALFKAFYEAAAEANPLCQMNPNEPRLRWTMEHIGPHDDVVDLGSNKLDMTVFIRQATRGRVVAVDLAQNALDAGKTRPGAEDIETVCCDASATPFPDNTFDCAVCCEILEHVPDEWAVVREAERIVRPGGKIVVSVPSQATAWDENGDRQRKDAAGWTYDNHVRELIPAVWFRGKPDLRVRYHAVMFADNGTELGVRCAVWTVQK